jgi:hypothetical protein
MMIDFVLPNQLKELVAANFRTIVFSLILIQVFCGLIFIASCRKYSSSPPIDARFPRVETISVPQFRDVFDFLALVSFIFILVLLSWLILDNAKLCWPDQSHITAGAMLGDLWMQIVPQNGRFSPMLHQEFLILSNLFHSEKAFYLLAILELVIFCVALVVILPFQSIKMRLIFVLPIIFSLGFIVPISGLIYPEVHLLLAIIFFLLLSQVNEKSPLHSRTYFLSASLIVTLSAYMIYLKEPVFLVMAFYAILRMCNSFFKMQQGMPFAKKVSQVLILRPVDTSILAFSINYAIVYLIYIYIQTENRYGSESAASFLDTLVVAFQSSPLLLIYLFFLAWRLFEILKKRASLDPVFDFLAFSFLLYFFVLLKLGMANAYYYLPLSLMAILLAAKLISPKLPSFKWAALNCIVLISLFIFEIQQIASFFRSRELYMLSRDMFVDKINAHNDVRKIYFVESADGYESGQLVAYLNYRIPGKRFFVAQTDERQQLETHSTPVIPTTIDGIQKAEIQMESGDIVLALPNMGGRDMDFLENKIFNYKKAIIFEPTELLGPKKAFFYSLIKSNPEKNFNSFVGIY